ncbi:alpha/beta hydrolase fold domain-containing protein [Treponema zioleckii]|uniref:alpha/beta hydrolase fold domain-containing protein n=1 Tax=Treponema zioleckii TaxID=331680 RepID=UPI00168AF860|nr:alpha/beta hydrolase fold domain-containing protein [Treponema zioleckii]
MSSSKDKQNAIRKLKALNFSAKTDVKDFRDKINSTFSSIYLPNQVSLSERKFDDVECDVIEPVMFSSRRILIYVHGGSFVGGSRKAYRPFVSTLANSMACKAYLPEFRLAPAFPYPSSVEDVQKVFETVFTEAQAALSVISDGSKNDDEKSEIIVAADTSGASIAVSLLLSINEKYRSGVSRLILFSPWLDISDDNQIFKVRKASDEVFTAEGIRFAAENYTHVANRNSPLVSPLKGSPAEFKGFPKVFIQMGEKELFLDDAEKFHSLIYDAGSKCDIDIWKGMMPMFQLADEYLSESHLAIEKIGKMITNPSHDDESETRILLKLEKN